MTGFKGPDIDAGAQTFLQGVRDPSATFGMHPWVSLQVEAVLVFGWRRCIIQLLVERLPFKSKLLNT
jgi:hypothetical protein